MRKVKVLQVYALTGLGHLREATAIKKALDKAGIENDTLDILKWADMYSWYTRLAVIPLRVFKWFFEVTTRNTSTFNGFMIAPKYRKLFLDLIRFFEVPLGFSLRRYLRATDYDVFLAVHPWGLGALWSFGLGKHLMQKLYNVIPDEIDVGSASFYGIPGGEKGPLHLVNSERVRQLFIDVGVAPSRVVVIGHTLDPDVLDHREQIYKRVQHDLAKSKTLTLGLFIGGTGTIDEKIRIKYIINHLKNHIKEGQYRIKVIPGPHLEFAAELQELVQKLGLTEQVDIFSSANKSEVVRTGHKWFIEDIDVLFAKTGELIFYTMATGIPHIHFPPKGSNEAEHVEFMKSLNAIYEFDQIKDLHKFLQNRVYLLSLSSNAFKAKYKLDGAYEIVSLLLEEQR